MNQDFTPSRHFLSCHIHGFTYYDGLDVIHDLTLGQSVQLVAEPNNTHDAYAVAIYFNGTKLGYIPASHNRDLFTFLYFGYGDIFEARILSANTEHHPERQFRIVIKVKDNRKTGSDK